MYRKTSQHNDAIKRQIESNPETLKHMQASLQKKQQDDEKAFRAARKATLNAIWNPKK
jgi:hypothetical protein